MTKQLTKVLLLLSLMVLLGAGNSLAANITIYDNRGYNGTGQGYEDQETEPGMINTQVWDLEGFFLNANILSMVGGWNFRNGVNGYGYKSGDIFIDTTGDAWYGKDNPPSTLLNYGYEYVIDVDWEAMTSTGGSYTVHGLTANSVLAPVVESYNQDESNPYRWVSGGDVNIASGSFTFEQGLSDEAVVFLGGSHYRVSGFDLSFVDPGTTFISHFTMGCGNDNLMGQGTTPVPEPATMLLLGSGLVGLAGLGRRRFFKRS